MFSFITYRSDDLFNLQYNGVNYFQMAMNMVSESIFDQELNDSDMNYVLGILMILIQYFYRMFPLYLYSFWTEIIILFYFLLHIIPIHHILHIPLS